MGWSFGHDDSRKDVIYDLTRDQSKDGKVFKTLRKCFRGNTMYALHESGLEGETRKWIAVYLLQRGTRDYPGWGYKPIEESMGPNYYDCPVSYLDEADETTSDYAKVWRAEVRKLAEIRKAKKPKKGETWSLLGCKIPRVLITSLRPLRGVHQGTAYRIPRARLEAKVN